MNTLKKYITFTRFHNLYVFILLTLLVFIVYRSSLGLTLYGDDWLVISKHLGAYGPGEEMSYWHPNMWFSNYAFQKLIVIPYLVIGKPFSIYFYISLLLRSLTSFGVYLISKRFYSNFTALVTALLFASISIGSETTDWVYNMNSYLGIFIALTGFYIYFADRKISSALQGWIYIVVGYITVPIRLYIIPLTMPLLTLFEQYFKVGTKEFFKLKYLVRTSLYVIISALPFLILRSKFPFLGWQNVNSELIGEGLTKAKNMLVLGKYEFLVTPFTNLGKMVFPSGVVELQGIGWRIYPLSHFLIYGLVLLGLAGVLLSLAFKKSTFNNVIFSFSLSSLLLIALKLFIKYNSVDILNEFSYFTWTYFGLIVTATYTVTIISLLLERNRAVLLYVVSIMFTLSFLYPWMYSPGFIFSAVDRYLILSGVGLSILFGTILGHKLTDKRTGKRIASFVLLLLIFSSQIVNVQRFFSKQLIGRNVEIYNVIFDKLQDSVPILDKNNMSLFYFEGFPDEIQESLLRFGFSYHMQLLYDYPFDEEKHPASVFYEEDLARMVKTYRIPLSNIYGFKWENGEMVDRTTYARVLADKN